jgi:hypothetical protein
MCIYECYDKGPLYFYNKVFRCGKVYYYNSIIITNLELTLIPDCWFENIFPAYFCTEITQQNFHSAPTKLMKYTS